MLAASPKRRGRRQRRRRRADRWRKRAVAGGGGVAVVGQLGEAALLKSDLGRLRLAQGLIVQGLGPPAGLVLAVAALAVATMRFLGG